MKLILSVTWIIIVNTISAFSQEGYTKNVKNCIEKGVSDFLIEIKMLDKTEEIGNRGFVVDLLDRTLLEDQKTSIYHIIVSTSHSPTFFLLKEKNKYKILDGYDALSTFDQIFLFLKNKSFPDGKLIDYFSKVTEVLKLNQSTHYPSKKFPITDWIVCDCGNR